VHLDSAEEPLEVALEALERLTLGVGDPLPPNRRHHLLSADADVRVREAALNLLSYRARTRTELRRKLLGKQFPPSRVDPCLDRLEERGLLDDRAVAAAFVRDRLRLRPKGPRRLTAELRAKGVDGDLAQNVVAQVLVDEGTTENDLARELALGWLGRQGAGVVQALVAPGRSPESEKARRRLHGYLGRRGFGGEALRTAMDVAVHTARQEGERG
jgi:regulatory protein